MSLDFTTALPTFFITLREGVEAALVVGIVLACLNKAEELRQVQMSHHQSPVVPAVSPLRFWVYGGVFAGIVASVGVGIAFAGTLLRVGASGSVYAPVVQEALEAGFCLAAVVLLSWMLVWMTQQAKSLKTELEGAVRGALTQGGGWGIFSLVMIAVLREGFETVLFIVAQLQAGWMPTLGAIAGLGTAGIIGLLLFQGGVKINLGLFFRSMGLVLLLIVSGLVVSFLNKLEVMATLLIALDPHYGTFCWGNTDSCLLGLQVWDASQILPDNQFPGLVLKSFLGYRQRLYLVQAVSYLVFLTTVGWLYLSSLSRSLPKPQGAGATPAPVSGERG